MGIVWDSGKEREIRPGGGGLGTVGGVDLLVLEAAEDGGPMGPSGGVQGALRGPLPMGPKFALHDILICGAVDKAGGIEEALGEI